jgi:hypothetical protein
MNFVNPEFLESISNNEGRSDFEIRQSESIIAWYTEENIIAMRNHIEMLIQKEVNNEAISFANDQEHSDFIQYYLWKEHFIGIPPAEYNHTFWELGKYIESKYDEDLRARREEESE